MSAAYPLLPSYVWYANKNRKSLPQKLCCIEIRNNVAAKKRKPEICKVSESWAMESCLAELLNGRGEVRRWGGGLVKACRTIPLSLGAILGQVFDLWINDKSHNFATIFNCNSSFLLCCFFVSGLPEGRRWLLHLAKLRIRRAHFKPFAN